jgi:hypothetical protein
MRQYQMDGYPGVNLIVCRPNRAAPVKLAYGTTACSRPVRTLQISAISLGTGG